MIKFFTENRNKQEKVIKAQPEPSGDVHLIIDRLNDVAGTNYKASTSKTKNLIQARLKEGFSLEDFNRVIDKKCREWSNTEMAKYLRPETLFGTKFESYLNQPDMAEAEPQIDYEEKRKREREACNRRDAENAALMAEQMGWNK